MLQSMGLKRVGHELATEQQIRNSDLKLDETKVYVLVHHTTLPYVGWKNGK